jgi:hypothetical protein
MLGWDFEATSRRSIQHVHLPFGLELHMAKQGVGIVSIEIEHAES